MGADTEKTLALASTEMPPRDALPGERVAPPQPRKLGRYLVIRPLGSGAMGVVYSAYDEELDRRVAIKLLRTDLHGNVRTRGLSRMRREAQALAKLSHPNVVQVYDVGEYENQLFLAMEFVRGATLREWLADGEHPLAAIIDVLLQAGRGLAAAHAAGLVHRDIKPDNVIVGDDGRVRVLDFGVARADASDDDEPSQVEVSTATMRLRAELTEAGMIIGTPAYMAPEQFQAKPADARTDIFGFCVVLYEALYGLRPFFGDDVDKLKAAVLGGHMRPPPENHQVPAHLQRILTRGLKTDPADRFPSMDALLDDLAYDPAAARRRLLFAVAALASLLLVVVAALSLYSASSASCLAASRDLDDLYDPQRRQRIADAVLASPVPFAASTWDRAAPRLDAYAHAWSAARLDACEAHRDGRQSPRLYDLRIACLDQRRAGFAALLDVLDNADDATIPKIAEAVLGLPRLDPCADTEALTAALQPPDDPATAAAVQAIRERLAQIESYESTGRYTQAADLLAVLHDDAAPLDYPPIHSEIKLREGVLALWQFQFDAADEALSAALFDAIAAGHDRIAADAAARLLYVKGVQSPDEAKRDLRLTAALVDKLRGAPEIEATYFNNLGVIYDLSGDIDEARAASERALELKRRIYGERHYEAGYSLSNLAMLDVTEGYHERARDRFVDAAAIFEETFGPDHPQTAALLSNLGNAYAHTGQWTRAAETYSAMTAIFAGSPASWSEMGPYILPDRGYLRLTLHRFDDAAADFGEALRLLGDPPPADAPPVIKARVGLASVAAARERWDEVDRRLAELDAPMSAEDPAAPFAVADAFDLRARRRLLSADAAREQPDQKNTSTERRENPGSSAGTPSPEGSTTPDSPDSPGDDALALADHTRAFEIRAAKSPPGSPLRAHAHLELARALLRFERLTEVAEHLAEARTIIDAELPSTSPERPTLERLTAALELAKGDPEAAIACLRRAVQLLDGAREPDDFDLALATFDLARALRRRDPTDPDARPLAERARSALAGLGPGWRAEVAHIDAWLAEPSS